LLLERGIVVSYETIRRWAAKFGPALARGIRRRAPRPGDIWHLDEMRLVIRGEVHWLWRAVDQHGVVLDEILQRCRDKRAAKKLLVRLLKRQGWRPRRIVTDKLASYGAAKREVAPGIEHRRHKSLDNRAENSHLPLRRRERQIRASARPAACSASPRSSRWFATSSSLPSANTARSRLICTGLPPSPAGAASLASSPRSDSVAQGLPTSCGSY
jgi:putative transposase